jgi:hypothetical protein
MKCRGPARAFQQGLCGRLTAALTATSADGISAIDDAHAGNYSGLSNCVGLGGC